MVDVEPLKPGDEPEPDADADVVAGLPPPSSRATLSRGLIVSTATAFIEEFGISELSMRKLGQALGVEAMSLYRYVPGREDLLDAVVESILDGLRADDDVLTEPRDGWQDFLQRLAHGIRRVALLHPKCFPLVAARPPEAPWLRPPLRSLEWVEIFLQGVMSEGFDGEAAVRAYRAFSSFLLGHLLLEVAALGADVGPLDTLADSSGDEDVAADGRLAAFPAVAELADSLRVDHAVVEFEESLEALLERIAADGG